MLLRKVSAYHALDGIMENVEQNITEQYKRSLARLSSVHEVEKELWRADSLREVYYLIANRTRLVMEFNSSVVFETNGNTCKVLNVFGASTISNDSGFIEQLEKLCAILSKKSDTYCFKGQVDEAEFANIVSKYGNKFVVINLKRNQGHKSVFLVLLRSRSFTKGEVSQAKVLQKDYSSVVSKFCSEGIFSAFKDHKKSVSALLILIVFVSCFFPSRYQVVTPAEVVPDHAVVVRAPIKGIVEEVLVEPFEHVVKGQALVKLDASKLMHELHVARSEFKSRFESLKAQAQQSLIQAADKSKLMVEKKLLESYYAKVQYLEDQVKKTEITADQDGVVLYNNKSELLGAPIDIGQKVLVLSDPGRKKLRALMNVNDAIKVNAGDELFFFNEDIGEDKFSAKVKSVEYKPQLTPVGELAYIVNAEFVGNTTNLAIGSAGKAKIYGEETLAILRLLRLPISYLRPYLDW